jgi:hypothetical protein
MKKYILATLLIISPLCAQEKGIQKMTPKIIQVEILVDSDSKTLKAMINNFLIDKKIQREDLLDIKFQTSDYKRALIIYEVNYEKKE